MYDVDNIPPIGTTVRHYVDGDIGQVLAHSSESSGRYGHLVYVLWQYERGAPSPYHADELEDVRLCEACNEPADTGDGEFCAECLTHMAAMGQAVAVCGHCGQRGHTIYESQNCEA